MNINNKNEHNNKIINNHPNNSIILFIIKLIGFKQFYDG